MNLCEGPIRTTASGHLAPIAGGVLAALLLAGSIHATDHKLALTEGNPVLAKVSSHLLRARKLAAAGQPDAQITSALPLVPMKDGRVRVEVRLEALDPPILEALIAQGLDIDSFHFEYAIAYGRIDPDLLDELAALAEVATIASMPRHGTREGSVSNQADMTMNTDDARTVAGVDGTGVVVGLLSDSFRDISAGLVSGGTGCNRFVTDTSSQTSGDLPNGTGDVASLADGLGGRSDEGRAIAELIFDIAPGADFKFHTAATSPVDFADGITELANCPTHLLVDDVFWIGQPFFQDGEIAQAAQAAVDAGIPYFSAAGNGATFGVNDFYVDSVPESDNELLLPNGDDFHDFGGGDTFAAITVPDDCDIFAELQWSQPFDGALGPGATSDLDLYLLSSAADPASTSGANIVKSSTNFQGCGIPATSGGNPAESVSYSNVTGSPATVFLAIEHFCGPESLEQRIVTISFDCFFTVSGWDFEDGFDLVGGLPVPDPGETPIFNDPQIFGHPAAKDVVAVAATFYGEIDLNGTIEPPTTPGALDVQPFSSLGGDLPFYFDDSGNLLPSAPERRFKPEVTGPDGSNTTFFGTDSDFDADSHPNFFGTSAAAPNVAGVAVLILDATDLLITPLALKQLLQQATIDMELPETDDLSGFGFEDALKAIRSLESSMTPLIDELAFDLDGGSFLSPLPVQLQRLQANNSLFLEDGDFGGLEGIADTVIFADGFESGDTSAWSN